MIEGRGSIQKRGSGDAGQVLPQDGPTAGDCPGLHGHCGQGEITLCQGLRIFGTPPFARTWHTAFPLLCDSSQYHIITIELENRNWPATLPLQWDYNRELARLGGLKPLPDATQNIYMAVSMKTNERKVETKSSQKPLNMLSGPPKKARRSGGLQKGHLDDGKPICLIFWQTLCSISC